MLSIGFLAIGLLSFATINELVAASKEKEAQRHIQTIRTSQDPKAVVTAIEELGKLGQIMKSLAAPAIPEIMTALKHSDPKIRAAAAVAIGKLDANPKEVVPILVKMLKEDSSEEVKIAVTRGLAAMGDQAKAATSELRELSKTDELRKTKLGRAAQDAIRSINARRD
jgi:HEAT repeat protein